MQICRTSLLRRGRALLANPIGLNGPYLNPAQKTRELCENSPCPSASQPAPRVRPFRLRWRIGKRKLELSQLIRLNCPNCQKQFEIEGVELVIFDAGAESFPITAIVDESCLVPRK